MSVLLLDPELCFADLVPRMRGLGWQRDATAPATAPLRPGEPEVAAFVQRGERVVYTYNPAVDLRVLDVSAVGVARLRRLRQRLPVRSVANIQADLSSPDPRAKLRGIFSAEVAQMHALKASVESLQADPDATVARAAQLAQRGLNRSNDAELYTRAGLKLMADEVRPLLAKLPEATPEAIAALRPSRAEMRALLSPEGQALGALAAADCWATEPRVSDRHTGEAVEVDCVLAELFAQRDYATRAFPGGWLAMAGYLRRDVIWCTWRYTPSQVRFDGLAWTGARWIWVPKLPIRFGKRLERL